MLCTVGLSELLHKKQLDAAAEKMTMMRSLSVNQVSKGVDRKTKTMSLKTPQGSQELAGTAVSCDVGLSKPYNITNLVHCQNKKY